MVIKPQVHGGTVGNRFRITRFREGGLRIAGEAEYE